MIKTMILVLLQSIKANRAGRMFSAHLNGLRMATKYTFRLNPDPEEARNSPDVIPLPADSVTAQTKGCKKKKEIFIKNLHKVPDQLLRIYILFKNLLL